MKTFSDYGIKVNREYGQDRTTCPECSPGRKKSGEKCLSVNIDEQVWHCMHCGWSGTLKQKKDYHEKVVYTIPDPVKTDLPDKVIKWFADRMIDLDTLFDNQIGYENKCIVFPYFDYDGTLVNKKYRGKGKSFKQVSGAKKVLFGLPQIKDCKEWIIVEGEMDKLSLNEVGIKNVCSVPDGAPPPNTQNYASKFSYLDEIDFDKIDRVIIAVDNDPPGYKLQQELIKRIGDVKCARVEWPEGCKDANEVLINHGREVLIQCVKRAKDVPIDGIINVYDIFTDIENLYDEGMTGGESTGWANIDEYYTVKKKQFTVVTGVPSHGKSTWLDDLLINLVTSKGWKIGIFSPEHYPVQRHCASLIQKIVGKPFGKGPKERMSKEYVLEGQKFLNEFFTFIDPPEDKLCLNSILELSLALIKKKGIDGLVIDPWNEIDHQRPSGMSETEYISHSLTKVRRFARRHDVHIWIVAHPTKLQRQANGNYPIPTPYDISGSAAWRNKADNCICVWRDILKETSLVQIHVQKVKFREVGKVGMAELSYDVSTGKYANERNWTDT